MKSTTPNSERISALERLPLDLVSEIVKYYPRSFYKLRLASRTLRDRMLEHALPGLSRMDLAQFAQTIDQIHFAEKHCPYGFWSDIVLEISFRTPNRIAKACTLYLIMMVPFNVGESSRERVNDDVCYRLVFGGADQLKFLKECQKMRVQKVSVKFGKDDHNLWEVVTKSLESSHNYIGCLELEIGLLDEVTVAKPMHLIQQSKVDCLAISVFNFEKSVAPLELLLNLSAIVKSIKIYQPFVNGIDRSQKFLFGLQNENWPEIIFNMMSKKLDKLSIANFDYPNCLSTEDFNALGDLLSKLGKKIWFEATWKHCDNRSIVINRHRVRALMPYFVWKKFPCFEIKHASRLNEAFEVNV